MYAAIDAIEIQKLPCGRQQRMIKGMERKVDKLVIHPLVIGYFFSNLSPIKPAAKFDTKPKTVKFMAFSMEYCALKAGYDLKKNMGRKLAIAASEK